MVEQAWSRARAWIGRAAEKCTDGAWVADQLRQLAGILCMAAGYLVFLMPPYIVPGGVVGLSTVLVRLSGARLPVGGVTWCVNIVLYLSTLHLFGLRYIARVLYSSTVLALFFDFFAPLVNGAVVPALYGPDPTAADANLLLYAVCGGVLVGTGMALVYRSGGATGGSDVAAKALSRLLPRYSYAQYMLVVDGVIIAVMVTVARNWNLALYAVAVKFVSTRVMEGLLAGVNAAKGVQIITASPERIARRIFGELKRGVTATRCTGMYTSSERTMLFCVVKTEQLLKLKAIVREEDPQAFVVLSDLKEVMGKGFTQSGL